MGFTVVCHRCGEILYEERNMIPIYRLMAKFEGRCPVCNRKLAVDPIKIEFNQILE